MDFPRFQAELRKKGSLAPVYVFAGHEAFLRDRGVALLKEADGELAAHALRVASSEASWARLCDELYTPPLGGKRKLVVLADDGNFVHNHAEAVREYLKHPSPSGVLAALVPSDKVPDLGAACVVECGSLKTADLRRWLGSEAQRLGKGVDRAALDLLVERGGGDLSGLMGHLEKLALHAGTRAEITAEDVRGLVGGREERKVYELSLAAASKDPAKAFRILRALLDAGEPAPMLLWKLGWQYRKLAEAKKLLAAGLRRYEVTSRLQITYYPEEFLKLVDAHTIGELAGKHEEILKADVAVKTSGAKSDVPILESLVCRLAADRPVAV